MTSPVTLCGSLSRLASPLGRSMHEAAYRALGISFVYVPFEVTDLSGALVGMRALGIRGFGVSHPYKQAVMAFLDELEPVAARIGAINTIVNENGFLRGHNTDWIGAVRALEEVRFLGGARVLLLGAGGAARAIAFGLVGQGAETTIANRTAAKAERLASEVKASHAQWDEVQRADRYEVVINATSMGQSDIDMASPVPKGGFHKGQLVMDAVYKPQQTRFLDEAGACGATLIHGGRMLLYQAAAQFELYVGRPAPLEAMAEALRVAVG